MSEISASERKRIEADAAWWNELATALGWTLHGFAFREHASFVVPAQNSLASISGSEASDILGAIEDARAEARP